MFLVGDFVNDLLQLDKDSSAVLRVKEDYRVSMCTNLRLRVNRGHTIRLDLGQCIFDVVDFQADVMHASTRVLHQKVRNRALFAQRLKQFQIGTTKKDENGGYSMVGQLLYSSCC